MLIDDLRELVAIPSISSDRTHARDMRRCAEWLAERLRGMGFEAALVASPGHPLLRATWHKLPARPTLLAYAHYDVQPPGVLNAWRTRPFEPKRDGEYLVGRGSADDKGPLLAVLHALRNCLAERGELPVNVTCVFEGEEEIGSATLVDLIQTHPDLFEADAALVTDTRSPAPDRPSITPSLRGLLSVDVVVRCGSSDLHAGHFGGLVRGAADVLADLIDALHDRGGRVALPGFYAEVRHGVSDDRRNGLHPTPLERAAVAPALTITALQSGHVDRARYVAAVPALARARLDFRLVPDQDPRRVLEQLGTFVRQHQPGADISLRPAVSAPPVVVERDSPAMRAMVSACQHGFGVRPEFHPSGATIPAVSWLHRRTRMPIMLLGLALENDGRHGPNERVHLPTLQRGVETIGALLDGLANLEYR